VKRLLLSGLVLSLGALLSLPQPVRAEGSVELNSGGGRRAFLDYRLGNLADPLFATFGIPRRTIIKVYVNAGETIELASSAIGRGGDIRFTRPDNTTGLCGAVGQIANRAAEINRTYTPCIVAVNQSGVWEIEFISPNPSSTVNPPVIFSNAAWTQPNNVGYVSAWDVTVRSALGVALRGRAYANYLALNMGGNRPNAFNTNLFVLTRDGYQYRINTNGLDPFGFIFFSNNKGFKDPTTNQSLFSSVATSVGSSLFQSPDTPDSADDFTNKLFFNVPNVDLPPSALAPTTSGGSTWLLTGPAKPLVPTNLTFTGIEGTSGQAGVGLGGTFSFNAPGIAPYQLILDTSRDGILGNANDRIFVGTSSLGTNTLSWDGRDANGNVVLAGALPIVAQVVLFAGRAHFPLLDAENNASGFIFQRLTDPVPPSNPNPNPFLLYYNDRGFGGVGAPNPISTLAGIDSSNGAHRWSNNFGDVRGIDTWVYYPSSPAQLNLNITLLSADFKVTKTHTPTTPVPGGAVSYTVTLTNAGPSNLNPAIPATFTDNIPATITNVTWTCAASAGSSCTANGSGNTISDPAVVLLSGGTATYTVTGTISPAASGSISNTASLRRPNDVSDLVDDDGSGGTNATESATDTFTLGPAIPVVGIAKQAGTPVNNGNGTFTIPYTVRLSNLGAIPLNNVQVVENLSNVYGVPATFTLQGVPIGNGITANPAFTGTGGTTNLLSAGQTLAVGSSATVTFNVIVTPNGNLGPYINSALATATDTTGTLNTNDTSDSGTNPDANSNGNPNDPGENDPTVVNIPAAPLLGAAKSVVNVVNNGNGTFDVQYRVTIENLGNVQVNGLQVVENLATTFTGANAFSVVAPPTSSTLTVNPGFNGNGNNNLLAGTNSLPLNQRGTIDFTVRVSPGANLGPYQNTATTQGTVPSGQTVSDISTNGSEPDPNNDGNPNEQVPTPVNFNGVPRIGIAKRVTRVVNNGNGTFTVTYDLNLVDLGNVEIDNIQVTDNLAQTYAGATAFTVNSVTGVSGGLVPNPGFNGNTVQTLLTPGQTFAIGGSANLRVVVTVNPGNKLGPYLNTALVAGTGPGNVPVQDTSDDGVNPDPNGNGNPDEAGENDPTPVSFAENPVLGIAKQIGTVVNNNDGTFTVPYTVFVSNLGNVALNNVQLLEDLFGAPSSAFQGATAIAIATPPTIVSGPLTATNPNFNGNSDKRLLAGTDSLGVGQSAVLRFSVRVTPGANLGPYSNSVIGNGTSPGGTPVTDISQDQTGQPTANPDPDGDGNPNNNNTPTPLTFGSTPARLILVKRITGATRQGTPLVGVNFGTFVDDPTDGNDTAGGWVQLAPETAPIGALLLGNDTPLQSNDEVTYTIYFLSDGSSPVNAAQICDAIPNGTTYIPGSLQLRVGNTPPASAATFFSPLAPLPVNTPCPDPVNPNGAIVVDLGTIPSAPGASNFGWIRFRVRID
jgi:uncharacterized repeat protein (TIGR01451 family)